MTRAIESEPTQAPRLHQPWRAFLALAEIAAAAGLVIVAIWSWRNASVPLEVSPATDGKPAEVVHQLRGSWIADSVIAATVAGILLLNAVRQLVLATRVRSQANLTDTHDNQVLDG